MGGTQFIASVSSAAFAAPAPGVEIALELPPGPDNPRNSEGAFLPLKDGRILFAYSRYYGGTSKSDHAPAKIAARYSSDKGRTWTTNDEIIVENHGGMNVMSVSLLRLQSGEIALFYLLKNSTSDCRPVLRRSFDEGKTWTDPVMCITDEVGYYVLNNDRVIQLKDGRLLFAVSLHTFPGGKFDNTGKVLTYASDDNGQTWRRGKSVLEVVAPDGARHAAQEPGVVELADGSVLLWIRTSAGCQYMSRSRDRGETWSRPQPSPLVAPLAPASIKRLPSTGHLLAVWNDHAARPEMRTKGDAWSCGWRSPLATAISRDEGRTWSNVRLLEDDPDGWFCYIAIEPLDDGTALLGYCAYNGLAHTRLVKVPVDWFYAPRAQGPTARSVAMLPGEKWWGVASGKGAEMPYTDRTDLKFDLYATGYGNQTASLLVSDKGRVIWCDEQTTGAITNGVISLVTRGTAPVELTETGGTLRDAFRFASRTYFPPSGRTPDLTFFARPQYNLWVELTYNENEKDILAYAESMLAHGLPPGILMIDDTWQADYGTWSFNREKFPNPKGMCDRLHAMGFKIMLWVCPWVSMDSPAYREITTGRKGLELEPSEPKGGFCLDRDGTPAASTWWNGKSALLDFTHPNACKWFRRELERLQTDYGVDGFKFDGGDVSNYGKGWGVHDPAASSGRQSSLYAQFAVEFPVSEYRCAWQMGGQPIVERLVDKWHRWADLQKLVPDMLAAGLMGHSFVCPDMAGGGIWLSFLPGAPFDPELFVRSVQVHALCGMMQFSASPWRFLKDPAHQKMVCDAVALRQTFAPRFVELAKECGRTGEPMIRHLDYAFPGHGYGAIRDQFLMGDFLMVAPVVEKGAVSREVAIPPGRWRADDGTAYTGPARVTVEAPLSRLPHFVRQ